jgi:hypothetical protein
MEGKYGRLRPVDVDDEGNAFAHPAKWDDDEPLFLFRAQDQLAPGAVWAYYASLKKLGLPQAAAVEQQWLAMCKWQAAHRDRVKFPD